MVKWISFIFLFSLSNNISAKEWKSLKAYQNTTHHKILTPSDWLKTDRTHNTAIWQQANIYNLLNNLPKEYRRIQERRDFYEWLYDTLNSRGHEIVWIEMAHFISKKMRLLETFPCALFIHKKIVVYANEGSQAVFNNAFKELKELFNSKNVLKGDSAIQWDQKMSYKEQYIWLDSLYKTIDSKSLKTIEHMAKGKFLYGLAVPKAIRFKGDISNPKDRYNYATGPLRDYCKVLYKD
ncbi:Insecticidal toxin complex protein [Yeosuana aromativorans]|uniref:Insecticidal toxin complex protein n=1 Tax=Yeosuana aromativorans TaxID=288019 RepID=UPI00166D6A70|nr:Insecticidal toxin complex protein [Yeosuana aromativorans]